MLESEGINPTLFVSIVGLVVLLLFAEIGLSSRKIKRLKRELEKLTESKTEWERLDLDEDGELSDLELEAYKLIRDKGIQPETPEETEQNSWHDL